MGETIMTGTAGKIHVSHKRAAVLMLLSSACFLLAIAIKSASTIFFILGFALCVLALIQALRMEKLDWKKCLAVGSTIVLGLVGSYAFVSLTQKGEDGGQGKIDPAVIQAGLSQAEIEAAAQDALVASQDLQVLTGTQASETIQVARDFAYDTRSGVPIN